jgi:hypothetical protein
MAGALLSQIVDPTARALATAHDLVRREQLGEQMRQAADTMQRLLAASSDPMRGWAGQVVPAGVMNQYASLRSAVEARSDVESPVRTRSDDEIDELAQLHARADRALQSSRAFDRWLGQFAGERGTRVHQLDILGKGIAIGGLVEATLARAGIDGQRQFLVPSDRDSSRFERAAAFLLTDPAAIANGEPLLLVDDLVATGGTAMQAIEMLRERYPASPIAIVSAATGWALFAAPDDAPPGTDPAGVSLFDLSTGERLLLE